MAATPACSFVGDKLSIALKLQSPGEIAGARDARERNICLILLINIFFSA